MPEGLFRVPELVAVAKRKINAFENTKQSNGRFIQKEIAPLFPQTEYVWAGSERVVVGHPTNPEKVVAYEFNKFKNDPVRHLEIYHFQRFFSALFPHNFPKFSASYSGENPFTVRNRVVAGSAEIEYSFSEVIEACAKLGIPLQIDDNALNFIQTNQGEEHFVDTVGNYNSNLFWKKFEAPRLQEYITAKNITQKDQELIWASLARLKELEAISRIIRLRHEPRFIPEPWLLKLSEFWLEVCREKGFSGTDESSKLSISRILRTANLMQESLVE